MAQLMGAIALAFLLGGADASPAWTLCGAAIPCALAIAAETARRIRERRAVADGAGICDVAIDPLAPDWRGTAQGIIDVFSHAIVESRDVRMRFLPCGGIPYRVAVLPAKRGSVKPRLAVSPVGSDPPRAAIEIPAISVRIPMPIEVVDSMESIWISPVGRRVRLLRCPPGAIRLGEAVCALVAATAVILSACGFFRAAILVALCLVLKRGVESRHGVAPNILWVSALVIATMLFHDVAPAFFGDPLRVAFYAYILPNALWRTARRIARRKAIANGGAK